MSLSFRAYLFIALTCILGIAEQWNPGSAFGLWKIMGFTLLLIILIEYYLQKRLPLSARRIFKEQMKLGKKAEIILELAHDAHWNLSAEVMEVSPPGLSIDNTGPHSMVVKTGSIYRLLLVATADQLGEYVWGNIHLRLQGRFGFSWWNQVLEYSNAFRIVPDQLAGPERLKLSTIQVGELDRVRTGSGFEFFGHREYQFNDPIKTIDWKASARSVKPVVKIFSEEQRLSLALMLDLGRNSHLVYGPLSQLNHYINMSARFAEHALINHNSEMNFVAYADQLKCSISRLQGLTGIRRLRNQLTELRSAKEESNPLDAAYHLMQSLTKRSLIVVLADLDFLGAESQFLKAATLLRSRHLPLMIALEDKQLHKLKLASADTWLSPYQNLAAQEMIEHRTATQTRLAKLGIPALISSTETLENDVISFYHKMLSRGQW